MNLLIPGMGILKGWGNQVLKIAWGGGGRRGTKGIASVKQNHFYMKNGEHGLSLSNISNQEEVGVCGEFSLRLLSLLKVFSCPGNLTPKGDN